MKKTTKIISVVLSILMVLSVLPMAVFAQNANEPAVVSEEPASDRVAGWKENYKLFLDSLVDDKNFTSWQYVDQNQKALGDKMNAYTFFALYDEAWKNYVTNELSIEEAKKILLAIIEKAEYTFDDGYVDEIVSVLEKAQDVNDFVQKVNNVINSDKFAGVVESEAWGTTFKVIGDVVKIANAYQNYRAEFIEAYARVLSVQLANAYYIDLLNYVALNSKYDILSKAASSLVESMNKSVNEVAAEIFGAAGGDGVGITADYLINIAINSNVYTATALKVYQGAKSIADVLWNTGDQYALIDSLVTAYYFQALAADWTEEAIATNPDKAFIAVDMLISTRKVSEDVLFKLKLAECGGVVGKIKNKLYGTVFEDIEIKTASLDLIRDILFNTPVAEFRKVIDALYIFCKVDVDVMDGENKVLFTLRDGKAGTVKNDLGVFASVYSEYSKDYLKIAYTYDNYRIRLAGKADDTVTVIWDKLYKDTVVDWSFTDVRTSKKTNIVFDTFYINEHPSFIVSNGTDTQVIKFNDQFVPSEKPEVGAKDVIDATVDVGKDEAKSFLDKIKDFFQKIADFFAKLFGGK